MRQRTYTAPVMDDLQPVFATMPSQQNQQTELEYLMTQSAFGYEYAKQALLEENELTLEAESLRTAIDHHKQAYFEARQQLEDLAPKRVSQLEQELQAQKYMLFPETQVMFH